MTQTPRAVLFDLDGTLLDSIPAFLEITRRACARLGWPAPAPGYIREVMTLGRSPIEALLGPVADEAALRRELSAASQHLWQDVFAGEVRLFADTLAVLRQLADDGFRLGIVTDSNHFVVGQLVNTPGCPPIEVVITRDEAGARKPSPLGIQRALAELGLTPADAVYVGDNPIDIRAAHDAGVRVFGITTGAAHRDDLLPHGPHAVLDALSELHAHLAPADRHTVTGRLASGLGEARSFLAIDWVRDAIETLLGGPFHPGTVNLALDAMTAAQVARLRGEPGLRRHELAARGDFCAALLHAATVTCGKFGTPALLLWPQVPGYPDNKLELICPIALRADWGIADGARLDLRYRTVEEPWP
jgi:HAD superfamily hydrolase (TIGR01509 family)